MAKGAKDIQDVRLTAAGRTVYFCGLFLLLFGFKNASPAGFLLGACLFLPSVAALWFARRTAPAIGFALARRPLVRAGESSPVQMDIDCPSRFGEISVHDPFRGAGGPAACFAARAAPGPMRAGSSERFLRRGVHRPPPLALTYTGPLRLSEATRIEAPGPGGDVLVLPRLGTVSAGILRQLAAGGDPASRGRRRSGEDSDIRQLRPYQGGDPKKRIHWPTTARTGHLAVKEYEDASAGRLLLRLALPPDKGEMRERRFREAAISMTATLLRVLSSEGRTLRLSTGDGSPIEVPAGNSAALLDAEIALAKLQKAPYAPGFPDLAAAREWRAVIIHGGSLQPGEAPGTACVLDVRHCWRSGAFLPDGGTLE